MANETKLKQLEKFIGNQGHHGNMDVQLFDEDLVQKIRNNPSLEGVELLEFHDLGNYDYTVQGRAFTEQAHIFAFLVDGENWAFYWTRGYGTSGGDEEVYRAPMTLERVRELAEAKSQQIAEYNTLAHQVLENPSEFTTQR